MNAVVFSFFTLFVLIMATLAVLKITLLRNSRLIDSIRDLYERNSGGWIVSGILVLSIVTIVIVFQTLPSMPQSFRQFLHRNYSEGYFNGGLSVFELLAILLAVVGAVFAILARIDARNAFEASRNLQRALSSFRSSFKDIMNDIPLFVDQSRKSLSIMIPTPMYGFVFGEREAALKFKVALTNKLGELGRGESGIKSIRLLLINPGNGKNQSELYLERASKPELNIEKEFADNTRLVLQAFLTEKGNAERHQEHSIEVKMLRKYDPHVRLLVAQEFVASDPQPVHSEDGQAMVVFTASSIDGKPVIDSESITKSDPAIDEGEVVDEVHVIVDEPVDVKFAATAFLSTNAEMVKSIEMLFGLYWNDADPVDTATNTFIDEFTIRSR